MKAITPAHRNSSATVQFKLRQLPRGIHRRVKIKAAQEGVSMEAFFVAAVQARLGKGGRP